MIPRKKPGWSLSGFLSAFKSPRFLVERLFPPIIISLISLLSFIAFVLIMTKKILKRKQKENVEKEDEPKKKMSDEPAAKKVFK